MMLESQEEGKKSLYCVNNFNLAKLANNVESMLVIYDLSY